MSLESDLFEKLNTKVLLLTGAGASKPLGMPLMRDFYDLLHTKSQREQTELMNDIYTVGVEEAKGTPDLEVLLALIERYRGYYDILFGNTKFGYQVDEKWKQQAKTYVENPPPRYDSSPKPRPPDYLEQAYSRKGRLESLDTLLRNLMFEVYSKELNDSKLDDLYSPLFKVIRKYFSQEFMPIFTTNYDVAIETYAIRADVRLETGFESTPTRNIWKPSRFHQFQSTSGKKNIVLFKLHGSLTWHRKDDMVISTGLPIKDPSGYKSVVMYPTQNKEFPDEEPFRTMYDFLKACFRIAGLAIVIGYSFRDLGIHRIVVDALELNPNLFFILVCGSNVEHWKRFAQQNLRSYQIITDYFDFAATGAPYLTKLDKALAELHS